MTQRRPSASAPNPVSRHRSPSPQPPRSPPQQHRSHARHPSTMTDSERAAYTAAEMSAAASLVDVPDGNTAGVGGQVSPGVGASNLAASQVMAPIAFNAPSSAGLAPAGQAK